MKRFGAGFFGTLGVNMLVLFLNFALYGIAFLLIFTVPVGFFIGFLLLFYKRHRELGAGMIAASGVSLLVAGFVCSNAVFI